MFSTMQEFVHHTLQPETIYDGLWLQEVVKQGHLIRVYDNINKHRTVHHERNGKICITNTGQSNHKPGTDLGGEGVCTMCT